MFPGHVSNAAAVAAGLPTLVRAMGEGQINTPARKAAFLATIASESGFDPTINEYGDTRTYRGRGYIQLTGVDNYRSAGFALGINLVGNPSLAATLAWSAPIARWYWTVARPSCNRYADNLQMGKINAAIGYPLGDGKADLARCARFAKALRYLGGDPTGATCTR